MYPFPEVQVKPRGDETGDNCGQQRGIKNKNKFESTSNRLGFYNGGT